MGEAKLMDDIIKAHYQELSNIEAKMWELDQKRKELTTIISTLEQIKGLNDGNDCNISGVEHGEG